jgi:hypothetical protein
MSVFIVVDRTNSKHFIELLLRQAEKIRSLSSDHAKYFPILVDHVQSLSFKTDWAAVLIKDKNTVTAATCGKIIQNTRTNYNYVSFDYVINCGVEKGEGSRIVEHVFRHFSELSGFKLQNAAGKRGFLSYTRAAERCNLHVYAVNILENRMESFPDYLHTHLFFSKHDAATAQSILFPPPLYKHHPMLPSKEALERLKNLRMIKLTGQRT